MQNHNMVISLRDKYKDLLDSHKVTFIWGGSEESVDKHKTAFTHFLFKYSLGFNLISGKTENPYYTFYNDYTEYNSLYLNLSIRTVKKNLNYIRLFKDYKFLFTPF
jgi:hypothetical protein